MTAPKKNSPCWAPALETLDRGGLERLQLERLRTTLARAARSPHYRRVFAQRGFSPKDFTSLAQLRDLPFTVKDDLRSDENFPYGFLTVRRDRLVRLHSSSGTTGRPTAPNTSPRRPDGCRQQEVRKNMAPEYIGAGLAALAVIGPGIGIGLLGAMSSNAIGRNPDAAGQIRGLAMILAAFAEGLGVLAIVIALLLALK